MQHLFTWYWWVITIYVSTWDLLKMDTIISRNDKESFKTFLDLDGDPDHHHNLINCSLYHCQAILKSSLKFGNSILIMLLADKQIHKQTIRPTLLPGRGYNQSESVTLVTYYLLIIHSTKKPVTTMLTYPWECTVLHCNHLGNTWKPLVLMTRHFDYCPSTSEVDNQSVWSSAPVVSRCFPGGYNVKLYISKGRLAWWLLAFLHSDST